MEVEGFEGADDARVEVEGIDSFIIVFGVTLSHCLV